MDVKSVKKRMVQALESPEDDIKYQTFINEYTMLLDQMKISADTTNIAIEAVKLDQGMNFLDTFVGLEKAQARDAWKTIKECEKFKSNEQYNALRLICSFAASALMGDENTSSIVGNILIEIVNLAESSIKGEVQSDVYEIINEFMIEMLPKDPKLPEWKNIKIVPEKIVAFCEILEKSLKMQFTKESDARGFSYGAVKKWIVNGKQYAEEKKILKEKEKNKPVKKSMELFMLAEHYKQLEDELDKSIYEATRLTLQVNWLQKKVYELESSEKEKNKEIKMFQTEIEELRRKVRQANQEVDERKKLNDAQVQYREDAQISLLQDIARALRPEYGDYAETKDVPMNKMLGEIYREKIKQIFKILEQKGIKVGD